ncbi:MAG TPA: glycosyltransferase family 2 protein [Pyrinomonadaceae bacterium]|nr:glycosyltransferase family 2 protein [Pyrinomonadaceae bacterium]
MPQVSVVITTHNRPHLLPRAVASARAGGKDVEVVVVDDASTDETAEVCRELTGILYVRVERNQRVAGARNVGILASSGDYITFLDDDDERLPGSLNAQLKVLESSPEVGLVYGQVLIRRQDDATDGSFYPETCPRGDIFWQLLERNFIPCGSVLFRRQCLTGVGLLDEAIPGVDDWDLWIRIAEIHEVAALEEPVAVWRQPTPHSGQGSSATLDLIELGARTLRQRWLALPRAKAATQARRREVWRRFSENLSEHLVWETACAITSGRLSRAGKSSLLALRLHPRGMLGVARKWARPSTLRALLKGARGQGDIEETKMRFKQMRLSRSKQ